MEGKRFGDCRNSGADELIAFHMNIGKQFFMIASSVNLSLFILRIFVYSLLRMLNCNIWLKTNTSAKN